MNSKLQEFVRDIGTMCEIWTIIYQSFTAQGMSEADALKHTQAFLTATLNSNLSKGKDSGEQK